MIRHFYRGSAGTSDGSPVSTHGSRGMKHIHQMWQQRTRQMLLSLQMNLAAIPGSIHCVRLPTHSSGLMVVFYQDPGLGCDWIQVGFFSPACDSKINICLDPEMRSCTQRAVQLPLLSPPHLKLIPLLCVCVCAVRGLPGPPHTTTATNNIRKGEGKVVLVGVKGR